MVAAAYFRIRARLALAGLLACSLSAADQSVEERLNALERQVQNLSKENADLKKELGWQDTKALVLIQPVGMETKLAVGGFLQAQGEFGHAADPRWTGVKDRFFFRRARIYVTGNIAEDFDFKAELDLQGNSSSASTGLLVRAAEIYLGWRKYPEATVRFGQLKSAFGAEQLANDTRLFTVERTLSNDRLTDGRQLGLTIGGEVLENRISYLVMLANGNGTNVSANDNSGFQKSAHVYFVPIATKEDKLAFGTGFLSTTDFGIAKPDFGLSGNLFTGSRDAWGVDGEWKHGRLDLFSEYLHNTLKPAGAAEFSAAGWQATAAYFLLPNKVQALVRHEQFDPNTAMGGDRIRSWTVGLNYLIKSEDLRLMLDYIHGKVPGSTKDGGRLLTRMQVIF